LITKGKIYEFSDYYECQNAIKMILFQYNKLSGVSTLIKGQNLYFKNTEIQNTIIQSLSQDYENMENELYKSNIVLLNFATKNYKKIL
jgi:hypothetical protein